MIIRSEKQTIIVGMVYIIHTLHPYRMQANISSVIFFKFASLTCQPAFINVDTILLDQKLNISKGLITRAFANQQRFLAEINCVLKGLLLHRNNKPKIHNLLYKIFREYTELSKALITYCRFYPMFHE